jgi:hypothetical protein
METIGPVIIQLFGALAEASNPGFKIIFCACIIFGENGFNVKAIIAAAYKDFSFMFFLMKLEKS